LNRKESDKLAKKQKRLFETDDEALNRKESDKLAKKKRRLFESEDLASVRRETNKSAMRSRRVLNSVSIDSAISMFHSKIQCGPDYVCTVCHRMLYKSSVVLLNESKFVNNHVFETVINEKYKCTSIDNKLWICRSCHNALCRGNVPVQAKVNGLNLDVIPNELKDLNILELRLISLRIPFMKMIALPSGKQRCIHGPAVNVPSKLNSVCTLLPRLPNEANMIPFKLKRKLRYKGHYMYNYVRPHKVMTALKWLKTNNPLYSSIEINDEWVNDELIINSEYVDSGNVVNNVDNESDNEMCDNAESSDPMTILSIKAKAMGFTICDVPKDNHCFFHAVSYQLPNIGMQCIDAKTLRTMIVDYLRANPTVDGVHYCNYMVVNDDDDAMKVWEKFLDDLNNEEWADNIAVQALSDMLSVKLNIISSQNDVVTEIFPSDNCQSIGTINLGLLQQVHYVCLFKTSAQCEDNDDNVTIDNENILEGDEHTRQIVGGPLESCMSLENPESDHKIYSIAPAEGEKPMSFMNDKNFEALCNPCNFPYGNGTFNTERERKLTYRKYFNQRLLDIDGRFAKDLDYLFVAQYIVEAKQILDDGNHYIWRRKPNKRNDMPVTAGLVKDKSTMNEFICKDKAYRFMKNVRGSPAYYQRTFYDLLAMIRQLGTPTRFLTLSAADMKWRDMIQVIARQYVVKCSDEEVANLSFEQKSNWLRRNPVTAARHFQYRLNAFFNDFLKSNANPLGEMEDYVIRVEFQARGSPHAHNVIWIKNAPKFGHDSDEEVCKFIDNYVSCAIPEKDCKLKELVLSLQQHKHSSYCKRGRSCRFHFPQPPSVETLIAQPITDDDDINSISNVLNKVHKQLVDGNVDVTIEELLVNAGVQRAHYEKALRTSTRGNAIVLKRKPNECKINNYNPHVMLAWQANTDIQYVLNAYACVMYVASYMMKSERAMGELLKNVMNENRTEKLKLQLRKVGSAFLNHREVSAQEAVYRILSMPMKHLSRTVVFVDTNPKSNRIGVLKDFNAISQLEDNDENVFQKSLIDKYEHRPSNLDSMCLAEFAANYITSYRTDEDNDVLPNESVHTSNNGNIIKLTDGYGVMHKRNREAVIRFTRFNKDKEPSNYYRAKLMLYYPWRNEDNDIIGGYETYEEHYNNVQHIIKINELKYNELAVNDVEYNESGPPEHIWSYIAPGNEESRLNTLQDNEETITDLNQDDIRDNNALITNVSNSTNILQRYESACNQEIISPEQYRKMMRELNDKQRHFIMIHRRWCKKAVKALKTGKPVEPYQIFLSGPGGVGKSHIIKLVQSDTIRILKLSGMFEPDDVIVLLTASTGVAAFNINGMTLHSALLLGCNRRGFQPLSNDKLTTLRCKLSKLQLIIIDEISMVGSNTLLEIHKRLQQIKGVISDKVFGDVSVLAVGDFYQLPSIGQPAIYDRVTDSYAQLYGSGSLWVDFFEMIKLDKIMRQKDDLRFTELLCRMRKAECTAEDIELLKSREITENTPNYPNNALHVYRLNVDVDARNNIMLNTIASINDQYTIEAQDSVSGQTKHINLNQLSKKRSETGGLHGVLKIAVNARIMLTANVDVSDGLVNGAMGAIVNIITNDKNEVKIILVKFDKNAGLKSIQTSSYKTDHPNAVPIKKHEVQFLAGGKKGAEITRIQFPITLAWANTIHKVQGSTLNEIVVDMKGRFCPGQAYVACSRVKSLSGLYIKNFNLAGIKKSTKVNNEMTRLSEKLVKPIPMPMDNINYNNVTATICLLNVRSINSKFDDIKCDKFLQSVDILCICETWLTSSNTTPNVVNGHNVIRYDRNSGSRGGGLLISCKHIVEYSILTTESNYGIEYITGQFVLFGYPIILSLVYRPPQVSITNVFNALSNIIRNFSEHEPMIILGDFNEDVLVNGTSTLIQFMNNNKFQQFVKDPTTDRATMIDLVFARNVHPNIVGCYDIYYSDHDAVYFTITQL
jgi:hypothetical protein